MFLPTEAYRPSEFLVPYGDVVSLVCPTKQPSRDAPLFRHVRSGDWGRDFHTAPSVFSHSNFLTFLPQDKRKLPGSYFSSQLPTMKRKGKAVKHVDTTRDKTSLLMGLPPEIHGMIADNVSTSQV